MKITKARLKQIIKEELQSEVIGLAFAAQAKKKIRQEEKTRKRGQLWRRRANGRQSA